MSGDETSASLIFKSIFLKSDALLEGQGLLISRTEGRV